MAKQPAPLHPADIQGLLRLAADGTGAVTDIVEAMHEAFAWPIASAIPGSSLLSGLVYSSVRGVAQLVGSGVDLAAPAILPLLGERETTPQRNALISVLNGVIGDHLAATGNPLALAMELRRDGAALPLRQSALEAALPAGASRAVLLVHGLCGTHAQWKGREADYGELLEARHGFTALTLRYNSGRHISTNGRELAALLEALLLEWPGALEDLLLVGHSMGGLVLRSAVHYGRAAAMQWPARVRGLAFLGSPHHGAPLERGGQWFEQMLGAFPYAAPLSRLGQLRSAGITDLRHGNLVDEDWNSCDRFAEAADSRVILPLPEDIDCLAVAATTGSRRGDALDRLLGDGMVPVASALGRHADVDRELRLPEKRRVLLPSSNHMSLLGHPGAAEALAAWLA